jgi:hypothetical protein
MVTMIDDDGTAGPARSHPKTARPALTKAQAIGLADELNMTVKAIFGVTLSDLAKAAVEYAAVAERAVELAEKSTAVLETAQRVLASGPNAPDLASLRRAMFPNGEHRTARPPASVPLHLDAVELRSRINKTIDPDLKAGYRAMLDELERPAGMR